VIPWLRAESAGYTLHQFDIFRIYVLLVDNLTSHSLLVDCQVFLRFFEETLRHWAQGIDQLFVSLNCAFYVARSELIIHHVIVLHLCESILALSDELIALLVVLVVIHGYNSFWLADVCDLHE